MEKKILLSGIKPTGSLHIANYFGALKQLLDLQGDYDTFVMLADLHDLGSQTPEVLRENIFELAIACLAVGLDPNRMTLFQQSAVPEHTELAWFFHGLLTVPYLQRAHAYKDALANGKEPLMTLFSYPLLMAADILMYRANVVPVGQDQKQHIEIARDVAEKFNARYGNTFPLPEPLIVGSVATVPGTDGRKMSKSYGNTIPLFASDEEIEKAVLGIPTDSRGVDEPKEPERDIVFQLHALFAGDALPKIRRGYEEGGLSYANSKKMLIEEIRAFIAPLRERRTEIAKDRAAVLEILKSGAAKARGRTELLMREVREKIGLTLS